MPPRIGGGYTRPPGGRGGAGAGPRAPGYRRPVGSLLEAALPLRCAACARPAPRGLCRRCALAAERLVLPDAGWEELDPGVGAIGLFAYAGLAAEAVRGLKLGGRHAGAEPLGALLRRRLPPPAGWPVTWVPSTRRRLRERGFELTRLLAGPGAVALLDRVADRPDQTSLAAPARRAAPLGAFRPRGRFPGGRARRRRAHHGGHGAGLRRRAA